MDESNRRIKKGDLAVHFAWHRSIHVFVIWLVWGASAIGWELAQDHKGDDGYAESSATFRIDRDEPIVLPGKIQDTKLSFVVDTGSSFCALDNDFQTLLQPAGGQLQASTPSGVSTINLFKAPQLEIGATRPIRFQSNESVACFNLLELKGVLGVDQIGILGMDFLKNKVVHLNFDEGIGSFQNVSRLNEGHSERLYSVKRLPAVFARLPSEGFIKFVIDTGFDGPTLRLEPVLFEKLLKKQKLMTRREANSVTVNSTQNCRRLGYVDCMEFGPHRFSNVTVVEGSINAIGLAFLRRFEVELDFPNQTARFRSGLRINEADSRARAGMSAKRAEGKWLACDIVPSSEAEKCGILEGDEIQSINGVSADTLSLRKIAILYSQPETTINIAFKRNSAIKAVALRLKNDPEPFTSKSPHELIGTSSDFDD